MWGSATLHLAGRNTYFGFEKSAPDNLNKVINNIFFHIEKVNGDYPLRWFSAKVLALWREQIAKDWKTKYNDVIGFETLVELPRKGECYIKDKWDLIGQTKGFTCKRGSGEDGKKTDNWGGARVWDTENLRPKLVFAKKMV